MDFSLVSPSLYAEAASRMCLELFDVFAQDQQAASNLKRRQALTLDQTGNCLPGHAAEARRFSLRNPFIGRDRFAHASFLHWNFIPPR
jgi:hypothetical protein